MKRTIFSILAVVLSVIVWLHWGGLSNGMGTFIVASAAFLVISAINEKSEKKVKE